MFYKMKYIISLTILLLVCTTSGLGSDGDYNKPNLAILKSLSAPQKLGILAASQLPRYSSILKGITFSDLFSPDDFPYVDYMFVDIRSLFIQSLKVEEKIPLPEIAWSYIVDINEAGFVFNITVSFWTGETQMIGQTRTTSVNEITPTSFKNSFHVPSYIWRSPGAGFKVEDNYWGDFIVAHDYFLGINNLYLNTSLDYEYVPDVGIQISNLDIGFDMSYWRANIENTTLYLDGVSETYPPNKYDYRDDLLSSWKYYQIEYLESLEFRINCVLSDSRNNPTRCALEGGDYYVSKDYFKMNVLQLIETIGLASLNKI